MPTPTRISKPEPSEAFGKKWIKYVPLAALIIAFLAIILLRVMAGNEPAPGADPYLHARLARTFQTRGVFTNDHLIIGGMPNQFTPYKAVVALMSYPFGAIGGTLVAQLIFALITLLAIQSLLDQLERPPIEQAIILTVLALSPTFLYDSLITGPHMAATAFIMTSAALLLNPSPIVRIGGLGSAILASTFSPVSALITILFNTIGLTVKKVSWKWIALGALAAILGTSLAPTSVEFSGLDRIWTQNLVDVGGMDGFSTFAILLGAIGMWLLWPEKLACVGLTLLILYSFKDTRALGAANIAICMLSGSALYYLVNRKWRLGDLKRLAILVAICGLLFSTISAGSRMTHLGPSNEFKESLTWLLGHSRSGQVVLSSAQNGNWIEYFAVRPVMIDNRVLPTDNRSILANEALQTYNIQSAQDYLRDNNVTYILITPEMTSGGVWPEPNMGLDYLLADHETFKKIYGTNGIEIHEFLLGQRRLNR